MAQYAINITRAVSSGAGFMGVLKMAGKARARVRLALIFAENGKI
jgi:hypothetical protein